MYLVKKSTGGASGSGLVKSRTIQSAAEQSMGTSFNITHPANAINNGKKDVFLRVKVPGQLSQDPSYFYATDGGNILIDDENANEATWVEGTEANKGNFSVAPGGSVQINTRIRIGGVTYAVVAISGDGTAANSVELGADVGADSAITWIKNLYTGGGMVEVYSYNSNNPYGAPFRFLQTSFTFNKSDFGYIQSIQATTGAPSTAFKLAILTSLGSSLLTLVAGEWEVMTSSEFGAKGLTINASGHLADSAGVTITPAQYAALDLDADSDFGVYWEITPLANSRPYVQSLAVNYYTADKYCLGSVGKSFGMMGTPDFLEEDVSTTVTKITCGNNISGGDPVDVVATVVIYE